MVSAPEARGSGACSGYARTPGCVWRWCDRRVLVLGPSGHHHELVGRAAVIWEVLDVARTRESVMTALDAWLGVGAADITGEEIAEGIESLLASGLVVHDDRP